MVRRSEEMSITLPPTKDWRALEQIRWSKLERDNEMFKKIQRHRYMNIIRSIQLEKSIKIKHYARVEEKLNTRMERLEKVKQLYNIPITSPCIHRKAKSCPLTARGGLLPSTVGDTSQCGVSISSFTRSPDLKSVKNEPSEDDCSAIGGHHHEGEEEEEVRIKRPPTIEQLSLMIQNFLEPLTPAQNSLVSSQYQRAVRVGKSMSVPAGGRRMPPVLPPDHEYRKRGTDKNLFRHKSFYLTT